LPRTIYDLKPAFQKLLRPPTRLLYRLGVTANQVTVAAVALSLLTGAVLCFKAGSPRVLLLLPATLFLRAALNAIDGMLAKEFELKTRLGALLNELGDVFSDAALYLPLALGWHFSPVLIVLVVVLAIISEMSGVLGLMVGAGRRYDGPLGKSDRAFVLGLTGLAIGVGIPMGSWQNVLLAAMLLVLAYTIYNRVRMALWRGD
jgi:CDP-diacylglycerol---glycerol-3-phosphate 3-phosphatidyltransferase